MKIGIIGSGLIGATLARKLSSAGHSVYLSNSRGPESLADFAAETGVIAATPEQAVQDAKVIIISVPFTKIPELKPILARISSTAIIADTSNYFPHRDGRVKAIDDGQIESLWVCEQLGYPVVKAWNTILAGSLALAGCSQGTSERIGLPISGDNNDSVETIIQLVNQTGFDGFNAGTLQESWRQQPGNPVYCTDLTVSELPKAIRKADRASAPIHRDKVIKVLAEHVGENSFDQMTFANNDYLLRINREIAGYALQED